MHLLLDLVPRSMPPDGARTLDPVLRARAVRMFSLYTSDRPSLARAALKAAQVCPLKPRPWPLCRARGLCDTDLVGDRPLHEPVPCYCGVPLGL